MRILPFFLLLACLPTPGRAAERHFAVSGFEKVRVEGPFRVEIIVGVPPMATASGSPQGLDRLSLEVQGRTLVIRPAQVASDPAGGARGMVTVQIGTHDLSSAMLNGSGMMTIRGVRGLSFLLNVAGSGMGEVNGEVDQLRVAVVGSGSARLSGHAARLEARIKGSGGLDAAALVTKDQVVGTEGPVTVTINASNSVALSANGPATIIVSGGAACRISGASSASVTGCR